MAVSATFLLGAWLRLRCGAFVAFNRDAGLLVLDPDAGGARPGYRVTALKIDYQP